MGEPYLYEGLEASLYDALDELSGFEDLNFYRLCLQAVPGPALDVGCGTGRVLIPLKQDGEDVTGLDFSSEMLDRCRTELAARGLAASLFHGDMRDFDLGWRRFATVMIPGYTIQLLETEEDALACLRCCRTHLMETGQVIFPHFMPWDYIWNGEPEGELAVRKEARDRKSGERLRALQAWELDKGSQRLLLHNVYERLADSGTLIASESKRMALRWYSPQEMLSLLSRAGFGDVFMYDEYTQNPPHEQSETVVYVASS